jgi:hypothetical protein
MLSVDESYGGTKAYDIQDLTTTMRAHHVAWQCCRVPHGWDNIGWMFNLDGYSLSLVGPDGIVRAVDVQPDEIEKMMSGILHR